jgi:hypothetical protein
MQRLLFITFLALLGNCFLLDYGPEMTNCKIEMHLCIVNNDSTDLYFMVTGIPDLGPQDEYHIFERYLWIHSGDIAIDTIARTWEMESRCSCSTDIPYVTLLGNREVYNRVEVFLSDSLRGLEYDFKSDTLHIVYDTIVFPTFRDTARVYP